MKSIKAILITILASGSACFGGCSDDSSSIISNGSNGNTDDTLLPDDPPPVTDPCTSPCTENAMQCKDNSVWKCLKDETDCPVWKFVKRCEEATQCAEDSITCISDCSMSCDEDNAIRCNDGILQKCVSDENGCGRWEFYEQCDAGCSAEPAECIENCTGECTPGEKRCEGNGISTCIDSNGKGCGAWGASEPCSTGKECVRDPVECIDACTSQCKEGDTQFLATSYKLCRDSDGHGCMKWETQVQCNQGEYLDKADKKCKPVCGENCEKFSIVFLPDTQEYVRPNGNGEILREQLAWINKNYKSKDWNIKAVMHLGDMTDTNDIEAWKMNNEAYAKYLDTIDLAYLPSTGNHDYLMCESNASAVSTCYYSRGGSRLSSAGKFNNDRFKSLKWSYAKFGTFKSTGNAYLTMTVSGIKFLLMTLEFAPRKSILCWAEDIIRQHPDHKVIIETHAYLNSAADTVKRNSETYKYDQGYTAGSGPSSVPFGASGKEVLQELASRHNNIILVASGHVSSNTFRLNKGNQGNWFGEMLVDYQEENPKSGVCAHTHNNGGSGGGWMRILTFDPANYTIEASTISSRPVSYFANNNVRFYCTPNPNNKAVNYAVYPDTTPGGVLSAGAIGKTPSNEEVNQCNTTKHKFTLKYDFVTPVDYKVTDRNVGFTHNTINSISHANQLTPAVAMSRTTLDFVAVWGDDAYNSSGTDTDGKGNQDIVARVFCETGCSKVDQFTVNTTTTGHQHDPATSMNPKGDFVVVWVSDQDNSVYMRKFDLTGKELIKETKVNTSGKAEMPKVAMADDGSFVVTWQNGEVFMRGFDASGKERFSQTKVSAGALKTGGSRAMADIGMSAKGDFVVTWEDDADGNAYYEIRARGFNKDGSQRFAEFGVNVISDGQQRDPSIGMNSEGDFTIAWEDDTDRNDVYRIRMRGFNQDGTERVSHAFVSAAGEAATDPSICMSADGTTYFTWAAKTFKSGTNTYSNVAVQSISTNLEAESLVNPIYSGTQDQPAIACAANGKHVVLWHDDLDENGAFEIVGKGFKANNN